MRNALRRSLLIAFSAVSLAAAPAVAAQAPEPPPPPAEARDPPRLEGEAIGYLAVPVLLVLVVIVGLLVGGGGEEPDSP
jgi:hypothetical protein